MTAKAELGEMVAPKRAELLRPAREAPPEFDLGGVTARGGEPGGVEVDDMVARARELVVPRGA